MTSHYGNWILVTYGALAVMQWGSVHRSLASEPLESRKISVEKVARTDCSHALELTAAPKPKVKPRSIRVLATETNGEATGKLYQLHLRQRAQQAFDRRKKEYEAIESAGDLKAYQARRREFFIKQLGGFPDRAPLNAKITGTIQLGRVRVEKILFESRPQHHVSALLFLPLGQTKPVPGVLFPCGHTPNGKAAVVYQKMCLLLAHHGMAALSYDPIGQGERYQLLDTQGKPRFQSTTEHTLLGVGSILVGRNTASYRVWDGIRALDYLAARPEVDGNRLGCVGNSGGGTLTEYLMAIDDRIVAAAPSCCVTTFARRLDSIGPGDAEQNIFGQIGFGLDHADYTILRAPKPTLLMAATQDYVDIRGSWEIFRETKRVYSRLGFAERNDLIEVDGKHGLSRFKREAAVRWMSRWLAARDEPLTEPELMTLSAVQAQCSPEGQVQRLAEARSVMDFNQQLVDRAAVKRASIQTAQDTRAARQLVRSVCGIRSLDQVTTAQQEELSSIKWNNRVLRRFVFSRDGFPLPALLLEPKESVTEHVLFLTDRSFKETLESNARLTMLCRNQARVWIVQLRGCGETGPVPNRQWGGDWDSIFTAYLLGSSILRERVEDLLSVVKALNPQHEQQDSIRWTVVAENTLGPPALHAVSLEPNQFARLELHDTIRSWKPVVTKPDSPGFLVHAVHGALLHYDLADLAESLPAEMIEDWQNGKRQTKQNVQE